MIARGVDFARGLLVRAPDWIGDAVAVEPLVDALAEAARERGALSIAARSHVLALFEGRWPEARRIAHGARGAEDAREWRGHGSALLLTGSWRSAWLAWRAGIARRIGHARDGRAVLLTDAIAPAREAGARAFGGGAPPGALAPRWLPRPLGRSAVELGALLGVAVRREAPRIDPTRDARAAADTRLGALELAATPFALLAVGGRERSSKAWAAERWAALAEGLARAGLRSLAVAGPGEEASLDAFARLAPGALLARAPLAGLQELAALAARAALVVTTDSGTRHVATAAGGRVLVLFGSTDPRHTPAPRASLALGKRCGPCHAERCPLPAGEERACLASLDPADVARAALLLAAR